MTKNKELFLFITIGIIFYLFVEVLTNFVLYINAVIFLQWKDLSVVLLWIIIYLSVIFGEIIIFSLHKINENSKIYILVLLIACFRILTQFYFIGEIYLLFITALFISILIFFTEIFLLFRRVDYFQDYQLIIGGIIFGLGIHFFLLILNMSSNLTVNILKIPFTFAFVAVLFYFNQLLFKPNLMRNERKNIEVGKESPMNNQMSLIHFILFGILLFLCVSWIFNPMSLAAYDVIILNWYIYGFLYYSLIILATSLISFFFIRNILNGDNRDFIKKVLIISNAVFCAFNCLALFIIDTEYTILSTIYTTILAVISVFTLLFNISYLIHYYTFPSRSKSYAGIVIFFFSFAFSYAVAIIFTWSEYRSLLISVLILSAVYFVLFIGVEIRKITNLRIEVKEIINRNKLFGAIFIIIFGINIVSFSIIVYQRRFEAPSEGNPTIMVWNIHNGIGLDGKFDLDRLIDEIKEYDPDILGLNEVDMGVMKTSFVDITSYFAQKLNMYCFYGPTFFKHYGNAILTKYPFEKVETIDLPCSDEVKGEPRGVIRAEIKIDGDLWTIYINHLSTKVEDRLLQVPFIIEELIDKHKFERVIWMGDFNLRPPDADDNQGEYLLINETSDLEFRDSHKYLDPDPELTGGLDSNAVPSNRIDYIFCSPDLVPLDAIVHCSVASDHCAVITEF